MVFVIGDGSCSRLQAPQMFQDTPVDLLRRELIGMEIQRGVLARDVQALLLFFVEPGRKFVPATRRNHHRRSIEINQCVRHAAVLPQIVYHGVLLCDGAGIVARGLEPRDQRAFAATARPDHYHPHVQPLSGYHRWYLPALLEYPFQREAHVLPPNLWFVVRARYRRQHHHAHVVVRSPLIQIHGPHQHHIGDIFGGATAITTQ